MIAQVVIDLPGIEKLSYYSKTINDLEVVFPGDWVVVEVKKKLHVGLVVETLRETPPYKLKGITKRLSSIPKVDKKWIDFVNFASRYYHRPLGQVAFNSFPSPLKNPANFLGKQQIIDKKYFSEVSQKRPLQIKKDDVTLQWFLNKEQKRCCVRIKENNKPKLLFGITGSGKTRVYFSEIRDLLKEDKDSQILYLVPEIGLTPQLKQSIEFYFPDIKQEIYTSTQTPLNRAKTWILASSGKIRLILGTRIATFLPMPALKLIIIDEEHDSSFKQHEGFRFSARDLSIFQAKNINAKIILGSATPSLESLAQVTKGQYDLLKLEKRATGRPVSKVTVVKKTSFSFENGLSEQTLDSIRKHMNASNQVLIYLNRKGWAPVLTCTSCGWSSTCVNCSANLVLHKNGSQILMCHFCGYSEDRIENCRVCNSNALKLIGMGTEKLAEKLTHLLPNARILRIDRNTIQKKKQFREYLTKIKNKEVDILIGTQILTKGHDFESVTLVVAVDIESNLKHPDFRASERAFQALMQVAGRAGRHVKDSKDVLEPEFILEVLDTDSAFIQCVTKYEYTDFANKLIDERQQWNLPPFTNIAIIDLSYSDQSVLKTYTDHLLGKVNHQINIEKIKTVTANGPLKVYPERLKKTYRSRLILESKKRSDLHSILFKLRTHLLKGPVKAVVDVDPVDF